MTTHKPTSCRIGVKIYRINWEKQEWTKSSGYVGQHDPNLYVIRVLDEDIQSADQAHIFLHEVMHALFDTIPCELVSDNKISEETSCEVVSNQLTEFFMNNPEVLNWYVESVRQ